MELEAEKLTIKQGFSLDAGVTFLDHHLGVMLNLDPASGHYEGHLLFPKMEFFGVMLAKKEGSDEGPTFAVSVDVSSKEFTCDIEAYVSVPLLGSAHAKGHIGSDGIDIFLELASPFSLPLSAGVMMYMNLGDADVHAKHVKEEEAGEGQIEEGTSMEGDFQFEFCMYLDTHICIKGRLSVRYVVFEASCSCDLIICHGPQATFKR